MSYVIKNITGHVLYEAKDATDLRSAVEEAVRARANLSGADLSRADLSWANLTRANLTRADLSWANLTRANLTRANLSGANLTRADLSGANLSWANLTRADLTGADLSGANLSWANLTRAYLSRANLSGANLSWANLTRAYLTGAYLSGANLSWANLTRANLSGANLTGANLSGANGIDHRRVNPLLMLLDQPGPIRAYKLVTADLKSPIHGQTLTYTIGKTVRAKGDTDASVQCGAGINVATLPWVIANWQPGRRILVVEFTAKDIAAIPLGDGKFRLHRCKVVGEKDLADLGLVA